MACVNDLILTDDEQRARYGIATPEPLQELLDDLGLSYPISPAQGVTLLVRLRQLGAIAAAELLAVELRIAAAS